jgi:hypothetical protein
MDCSERPVTEAILANLRGCAADGRRLLALNPIAPPAEAVAAADGFVDRWQHGDRPPVDVAAAADVPFLLGSLWGEAVVAAFGWAWVQVVFNRHPDTVATAVVSPDRSLALFPIHFILGCLDDPAVDCTMALSFERLAAGQLDGFTPGGYANVMDVVHRAAPRR